MTKGRNLYIYGAGHGGGIVYKELVEANYVRINGFVDKNNLSFNSCFGLPVYGIGAVDPKQDFLLISLMQYDRHLEVFCYWKEIFLYGILKLLNLKFV